MSFGVLSNDTPIEKTGPYETRLANIDGLKMAYQDIGNKKYPAVILIMGLGRQLIAWKDPIVKKLLKNNFRVIRFDNRDVGLSDRMLATNEHLAKHITPFYRLTGMGPAYFLKDMAYDVAGLMDHLKIKQAHLAGVSLGGMIAQEVAIRYPEKVISMSLIMTSSGDLTLAWPNFDIIKIAFMTPDLSGGVDSFVEYGTHFLNTIGSPIYSYDEKELKKDLIETYKRSHDWDGKHRQFLAAISSGPRIDNLKQVKIPTQIIHGLQDPLIPVEHGIQLAKVIPNSKLEIIQGMGHGFEKKVIVKLLDKMVPFFIEQNIKRVE